jgi:hypothetical protein
MNVTTDSPNVLASPRGLVCVVNVSPRAMRIRMPWLGLYHPRARCGTTWARTHRAPFGAVQ